MTEEMTSGKEASASTANIIYILYLVSLAFGLTGIVGVVMAYVNRKEAPEWLKTHYQFQIRTFWIGTLYVIISIALAAVVIGYLMLLFCAIWLIIRCVKGMSLLDKKSAHPNPTGWMF